jgi:hypothetical protein
LSTGADSPVRIASSILGGVDRHPFSLAKHGCLGADHAPDRFQRGLCPSLLYETDQGIDHDDAKDHGRVHGVSRGHDGGGEKHVDQQIVELLEEPPPCALVG